MIINISKVNFALMTHKPDNLRIGRLRHVEDGGTAVEIVATEAVDDGFDGLEGPFVGC